MIPYADDTSIALGGMTVENASDKIVLYGSLELGRDAVGLRHAQALRALLDDVIKSLERDPTLADALPPPKRPRKVSNPFGG